MSNQNANVLPFVTNQKLDTVTYRTDEWLYDPKGNNSYPDFKVRGHHSLGADPFQAVQLEVFVSGRQSNEHFKLVKADAEALRDMFADIANKMS